MFVIYVFLFQDGDICLTKQHNVLDYVYVLKGQYYINVVYRSRLDAEFSIHYDTNLKLQTIIENLLLDFPNHVQCFRILLNYLKVMSKK